MGSSWEAMDVTCDEFHAFEWLLDKNRHFKDYASTGKEDWSIYTSFSWCNQRMEPDLIGTSGENSIAAETMLNAIDDSYYSIWNWNVEDQMYDPVVGINSNSRPSGSVGTDAFIMQPGISYWVWATKDTSLPALGP